VAETLFPMRTRLPTAPIWCRRQCGRYPVWRGLAQILVRTKMFIFNFPSRLNLLDRPLSLKMKIPSRVPLQISLHHGLKQPQANEKIWAYQQVPLHHLQLRRPGTTCYGMRGFQRSGPRKDQLQIHAQTQKPKPSTTSLPVQQLF